jgi:hypothetical protein
MNYRKQENMRQAITLNKLEEKVLKDVLNHVLNTELEMFIKECKENKLEFESLSLYKDYNFLMYNCPKHLLQTPYGKALYLKCELKYAKRDEE